jgi:hypothetical protein
VKCGESVLSCVLLQYRNKERGGDRNRSRNKTLFRHINTVNTGSNDFISFVKLTVPALTTPALTVFRQLKKYGIKKPK